MKRIATSVLAIAAGILICGATEFTCHPEQPRTDTVVATVYKASCNHSRHPRTADGTKLDRSHAGRQHLIAVSWDLRKDYPLGTSVNVENAGSLSGIYRVRDLMNKRWRRKIDILVDESHGLNRYDSVRLTRREEPRLGSI